ncbi:hypothetical protein RMSM_04933 [Rhodopirellula maiorica SM1]|uniref:Uncharacterized protein n=1 Tax=Rhodopirellula maiorica SM1 TaxID=1265738 RepID=M5RW13_9BACT|nr:DUF4200 domain-containing protein [Rhodopirellula maiorica]EMI18144.1 hypothetical protein RMSM_04933 [Rhodopirellula maiorica SM1]
MKRQPSNDDEDGGLDSLLDTMTNVVGILVLVLIVTQMSVAEVVTRVTEESTVDEAQVEELQKKLLQKKQEAFELNRMLVDPLDIDADAQREELRKSKELLARRKKNIEDRKKQMNEFAMKIQADREMAEKNAAEIANTKAQREKMQTLIATSLERKAELEAILDKTPRRQAPPDIQVSIPNPRPAPPGTKEATFICVDNLVYPVNAEFFRKQAELMAKAIIQRGGLDRDPVAGIDPEKFTAVYEKLKDQDEFFDVEYFVQSNKWPRIRLIPREGRGANESAILNPRSKIRRDVLSRLDTTKYYGRFHVLPDSFDVYVAARGLFSDEGVLAGWEPQPADWVYTTHINGGIRLGPPPPPPKNPPDPNAPKPKPASVID